jgi:predicted kinase
MKLYDLLKEIKGKPKAILLAGAPGAGKSFIIGDILNKFDLEVLNIDNIYTKELTKRGVSFDLKRADARDRSEQAKAMAASKKEYDVAVGDTIGKKKNIVIDGTAGSVKEINKLVVKLKEAGYDIMMLYVYTSLEQSLERNEKRFEKSQGKDRSLPPAIVFSTWNSVTANFDEYNNLFGKNFISVVNSDTPFTQKSVEDIITKYLDPFKPTNTAPKTDAQKAKSAARKEKLNQQVAAFLKQDQVQKVIDKSVTKQEAQSAIQAFLTT